VWGGLGRIVSNEEFESAYVNEDNLKIIGHASRKYSQVVDAEELKALGAIALWKCLRNFKPELGTKFTTFLYYYVGCEIKAHLRETGTTSGVEYFPAVSGQIVSDIDFVLLEEEHRKPIEQRIIGRMSFREMAEANGRSKESERQNWIRIMDAIREDYDVD
jgi:DNA-directed RNA polymerase specialized sigma subunit